MMNSRQARPIVEAALSRVQGRKPELGEVYATQAVARFDAGYGNFKSPPHGPEGPTSNNWGAVQDRKNFSAYVKWTGIMTGDKSNPEVKAMRSQPGPPSPKPTEFFYGSDYSPSKGWFYGPYKVYPDPVDGAAHTATILKKMGVLEVARQPGATWNDIARKMYEGKYFTGYTRDAEKEIRDYARNLADGGEYFAKLFGETDPFGGMAGAEPGPLAPSLQLDPKREVGDLASSSLLELPTLRFGSLGAAVELWQRLLNADTGRGITLQVDGDFGPVTLATTRHWQSRKKLVVDGIVGPKSWGRMP